MLAACRDLTPCVNIGVRVRDCGRRPPWLASHGDSVRLELLNRLGGCLSRLFSGLDHRSSGITAAARERRAMKAEQWYKWTAQAWEWGAVICEFHSRSEERTRRKLKRREKKRGRAPGRGPSTLGKHLCHQSSFSVLVDFDCPGKARTVGLERLSVPH